MVSPKLPITIILVLLFFTYEFEGSSYSSRSQIDNAMVPLPPIDYEKVNLSIYYESLCQSCAIFIVKNLDEIFNNELINIVNLQLVPWANSHLNKTNNSISCQNIHYGLIFCFEFLAIDGKNKMWKNCFNQLGLPLVPFIDCFNSGNGTKLGEKYINETAKLFPLHSFVPWVVVNDQPIEKDYANFTYYVCKAYKGVSIPAACNVSLNAIEK
ncbi:gamma-interferon-responsive lysosomal thiol protein-like isoform X2 [Cicer arietinum]|uniref:Gamma-interferon-responsive lysosomal thiol protein-like isoform X2 n=1 Tax=Cicer arietinum TaxID=3827 RepID=A0A1S3EC88_CICAR|nr:gamma-interferon-responsive lysosomal thiol protein-like isoform X2 [Cicer arietinum]